MLFFVVSRSRGLRGNTSSSSRQRLSKWSFQNRRICNGRLLHYDSTLLGLVDFLTHRLYSTALNMTIFTSKLPESFPPTVRPPHTSTVTVFSPSHIHRNSLHPGLSRELSARAGRARQAGPCSYPGRLSCPGEGVWYRGENPRHVDPTVWHRSLGMLAGRPSFHQTGRRAGGVGNAAAAKSERLGGGGGTFVEQRGGGTRGRRGAGRGGIG